MQPKVYFNVITGLTTISVILVVAPFVAAASQFDFSHAWETAMPDGTVSTEFLPFGVSGVIQSFPLALYLLICFESLPVAVEETIEDEGSNMKWGMFAANVTLLSVSWITLIVCAGMPPGVMQLSGATLPYFYIQLQATMPQLPRPFKMSKNLGVASAAVNFIIAAAALI
ncbi:UNVERIFIED_CONTAM: hypothetical protein HDU68_012585, partial [Siphonaria sp. JEL0065]